MEWICICHARNGIQSEHSFCWNHLHVIQGFEARFYIPTSAILHLEPSAQKTSEAGGINV